MQHRGMSANGTKEPDLDARPFLRLELDPTGRHNEEVCSNFSKARTVSASVGTRGRKLDAVTGRRCE